MSPHPQARQCRLLLTYIPGRGLLPILCFICRKTLYEGENVKMQPCCASHNHRGCLVQYYATHSIAAGDQAYCPGCRYWEDDSEILSAARDLIDANGRLQ